MVDRLADAGKTVGIDFDFGDNWLAVNTLPLHQLLNVAREEGIGNEMKERFLSGYFEKSEHLNKTEVLCAIANEFGWNSEKVDAILKDEKIAAAVKAEIMHYQERGVTGVPFFVINDEYGISGAQPVEAFLEAFQSISAKSNVVNGGACTPNSGCC
jgi:predicted DsbA family dithiol-disulfide isomerase